MDAAQTLRKLALLFAVALLCAGAAYATVSVDPTTVTFGPSQSFVQFNVTSSGPYTVAVTSSNPWFHISSGASGNAPGGTVQLARTGCSAAPCTSGTVTVTSGSDTATVTVQDAGSTGGGGSTGLSSNPTTVTLTAANNGSSALVPVTITNSTASAQTLTVTPSASWISAYPSGALAITIPASSSLTIYISGSALGFSNTVLNGNVAVSNTAVGTLTIPVQLTVGAGGSGTTGTLTTDQSSLTFSFPNSNVQTLTVRSNTATSFAATGSQNWLQVVASSSAVSATGTPVYVTINPSYAALLPSGIYYGSVVLTNLANLADTTTIPVTLYVNVSGGGGSGTGVFASPASLNFAYQVGGPAALPQTIWVNGNDSYTISATGRFIANVPTITGPGSFTVQPNVFGATAGTSTGNVTITSNTTFASQVIPANLVVSDATAPVVSANVGGSFLGDIVCTTQSGCTVPVQITASDNSNLPVTITASNSWIVVSSAPATTPGTFNVQLVPTGLSGVNTGTISVAATGAANSLQIPVVLVLSGSGGGGSTSGSLTLNPGSVNFTTAGTQYVSVTSSVGVTQYTAVLGTTGCSWISMPTGSSGFTPGTIAITAVNPGTNMTCNITVTAGGQSMTLPVTFNGGSGGGTGTITLSATNVNLTAQSGSSPAPQTVQLTTTSTTPVSFTATPYVLGMSTPWITVTPSSGTVSASAPVTLNISANTTGLTSANSPYSGTIQVTNTASPINVVLTITEPTKITATPTTLTFDYSAGGAVPASKNITVTGAAANLPFSATVTSGSDWLSVSPTSGTAGTTGATVAVSVNPTNLQANKTYTGTIVVAGTGTATGSTTVTVTLNISAPLPTISRVTNGASFNTGAISAGEIITLFGTAIGPQQLQVASPSNGQYPTELGGVQVTVGGYLAPIIYVRSDQVAVVVPYEINRPVFVANVPVIVRYLGQGSNGVNLQQTSAAPGVFTTGGGTGQAAALNQNLTANGVNNPANKGEVIVLYVTGEGQTSPAGVTGKITTNATTFPVSGQVTVTIDGVPAQVQYAGEAPSLIAGVMQVNAVIPNGLTHSGDLPVVVSVGGVTSQVTSTGVGAATIAVR